MKLIIEENVSEFWVGNYGNFDGLSAKAVRYLKEKHPDIQINLVSPYLTSDIYEYKELYYKKYDHILMADLPSIYRLNIAFSVGVSCFKPVRKKS